MKLTEKQLKHAIQLCGTSPVGERLYFRAAKAYGISESAMRSQIDRFRNKTGYIEAAESLLSGFEVKNEEARERSRVKAMETELFSLRESMKVVSGLANTPLVPVKRREKASGLREGMAVALLSDVHCEETVRKEETPIGNVYNSDIADVRIGRFFSGFKSLIGDVRGRFKIRDACLWIGGDLMSGHIHDELVETTDKTPVETVLWLRSRIVSGIGLLLADPGLERLVIPCSYGNHGRNSHRPNRATGAAHSYEWLLYQVLAEHFKDEKRVQFLADKSGHQYLQAYGFNLHFHHGDETSYGGGVGGITVPLNKAVAQWDIARRCDYHNFGHWHQYIDTGRVAVNGSVIGYNAYAMSIKATPEVPQQSFYVIDSKRGKTAKYPIWVAE